MAISFPINPEIDQIYTSPTGDRWIYNGYGWVSEEFQYSNIGPAIVILDNSPVPTFDTSNTFLWDQDIFYVSGDISAYIPIGSTVTIGGDANNNGLHTIMDVGWNSEENRTLYTCDPSLVTPALGATPSITYTAASVSPDFFNVTTNSPNTYVSFLTNLINSITITNTNKTNANIGDILTIATKSPDGPASLVFNQTDFYLWLCGSADDTLDLSNVERNIVVFTFDGEKWCSTYDNC